MKRKPSIKSWTILFVISIFLATNPIQCAWCREAIEEIIEAVYEPMGRVVSNIQVKPSCGKIVAPNINAIVINWNCPVTQFSIAQNFSITPSLILGSPLYSNNSQTITIPILGGVTGNTTYTITLYSYPLPLPTVVCGGQSIVGELSLNFTVKSPDSIKPFLRSFSPGLSTPLTYSQYTTGDSRQNINGFYTDAINVSPHIRVSNPNAIKAVFNELMVNPPIIKAQRYLRLHTGINSTLQQISFPDELKDYTVEDTATNTNIYFKGTAPFLPAFQYLIEFPSCRTLTLLGSGTLSMGGNQDITGNPIVPCDDDPADPQYDARCATQLNDEIRAFATSRVRWVETSARRWFNANGISLGGIASQDVVTVSPAVQDTTAVGTSTLSVGATWNGYKSFSANIPGGFGTPWYDLLDDDVYILEAQATLSGGGSGGSDMIPIGKDSLAPSINIISFNPRSGSYVNVTPTVMGTWDEPLPVSGKASGIAGISFNVPVSWVSIGAVNYYVGLNLGSFADGSIINIIAIATDKAGNSGSSAPSTITLDKSGPSLTIDPLPAYTNNTIIIVSGTVNDALSGLPAGAVKGIIYNETTGSYYFATATIMGNTYSMDFFGVLDGRLSLITVIAKDNVGNETSQQANIVIKDTQPPVASVSTTPALIVNAGQNWLPMDFTVNVAATDPAPSSGLSSLAVVKGSISYPVSCTIGSTSCSGQVSFSNQGGSFVLNASTTDRAGNSGSAQLPVGVDLTGPFISIDTPDVYNVPLDYQPYYLYFDVYIYDFQSGLDPGSVMIGYYDYYVYDCAININLGGGHYYLGCDVASIVAQGYPSYRFAAIARDKVGNENIYIKSVQLTSAPPSVGLTANPTTHYICVGPFDSTLSWSVSSATDIVIRRSRDNSIVYELHNNPYYQHISGSTTVEDRDTTDYVLTATGRLCPEFCGNWLLRYS